MVASRGFQNEEEWGATAFYGYEVSFRGDKNVLRLLELVFVKH